MRQVINCDCECTCRMLITTTLVLFKTRESDQQKHEGDGVKPMWKCVETIFGSAMSLSPHTAVYYVLSATIKRCVQFETLCICVPVVVIHDDLCGTNRQPETASLSLAKTLNNKLAFCFSATMSSQMNIKLLLSDSSLRNSIQHSPRYSVALLNCQRPLCEHIGGMQDQEEPRYNTDFQL